MRYKSLPQLFATGQTTCRRPLLGGSPRFDTRVIKRDWVLGGYVGEALKHVRRSVSMRSMRSCVVVSFSAIGGRVPGSPAAEGLGFGLCQTSRGRWQSEAIQSHDTVAVTVTVTVTGYLF
jgi:hypothetical protein